ncbi:hypothetical protein BH23GEM9_BH23GEM9_01840 [soil metagenome]
MTTPARTAALLLTILALLLFASPATAQRSEQDWLNSCERQTDRADRVVHCELRVTTMALAAGALNIDAAPNGGIIVRGGDVSSVAVSAGIQVQAADRGAAQAIARGIRVAAANGTLRAEGPSQGRGESWSVTFHVTVPHHTNLDLATVNGSLSVSDVSGRIRAETTNGPLTLERLAGDVHGRTSNGPLTVALAGSRWDGAGIDVETHNGPLRLIVPEGYSAALEAGTTNGPLNLAFPVTATLQGRRTNQINAVLGSGGPPIRAVTSNGPLTLVRP